MDQSCPARAARVLVPLAWLVIPLLMVFSWFLRLPPGEDDFRIFRQAGIDLPATGNPYHSTPRPKTAQSLTGKAAAETKVFLYPPLAAHLFRPFARLSPEGARNLWFLVNLGLVVAVFLMAWRGLAPASWQAWRTPAFAMYFLSPPVLMTFNLGQVSLLLPALIFPVWLLSPAFPAAAGMFLAVAAHIKLFPALLAFAFLGTAQRVIAWSAFWFLVLAGVVTLAGGVGQWTAFLQTTLASSFYPVTGEFNISLNGFFRRLLTENPHVRAIADIPPAASLLTALAAIAVFGLCLRLTRGNAARAAGPADPQSEGGGPDPLVFSAWLVAMLLLSPLNGFYNHTLLLFPAIAILVRLSQTTPSPDGLRKRLLLPGAALLLACWWPPGWAEKSVSLDLWLRDGWHVLFLAPSLYGLILLFHCICNLASDGPQWPEHR